MPAAIVCVPARDEAERLPRLLRSLQAQVGFSPAAPLRVVVVANNCGDGTAEMVRALEASGAIANLSLRLIEVRLSGEAAHVGTARRMALDAAADWLDADGIPDGILLTTDADARPPASWVAANLRALAGADVVGGRLVIDAEDEAADPLLADLHARIERYWAGVRRLEDIFDPPPHDPSPRHGDHTAASLAVSARLYRAVGGLPAIPCGEDNALVGRLQQAGARLRHCPAVHVAVSGRRRGRVAGGMATEMTRRAEAVRTGGPYRLPAAGHWQALILRRARLRRAWSLGEAARGAVLADLGLDAEDRNTIAPETCPNDIAFVERANLRLEARDAPARFVDLDAALADLDAIARLHQAAA